MSLLKNKNFAFSLLAAGITDAETGITVTSSDGALFPSTGTFMAVIWGSSYASPGLDSTREIVEATFVSGDSFTIDRAEEGTSAKAWSSGDNFACVLTAGKLDELELAVQNKTMSYGVATGTNAYTVIFDPIVAAYVNGSSYNVKITNAPTGAVTLAANSLAAKKVFVRNGSSYTQATTGAFCASFYGTIHYDSSLDSGSGGWILKELNIALATLTDTQTFTNKTLTSPVLNTGVSGTAIITSDSLTGASTSKLADSASIKNYIDNMLCGSVIGFAMETPPDGFLECDGSTINRTTYAALFAVIEDTYGVGDGTTTFEIPDYRGRFLRGWDHGAGTDPDAASRTDSGDGSTTGDNVGTKQNDNIKAHSHEVNMLSGSPGGASIPLQGSAGAGNTYDTEDTGGNETRPININIMYCIKY